MICLCALGGGKLSLGDSGKNTEVIEYSGVLLKKNALISVCFRMLETRLTGLSEAKNISLTIAFDSKTILNRPIRYKATQDLHPVTGKSVYLGHNLIDISQDRDIKVGFESKVN